MYEAQKTFPVACIDNNIKIDIYKVTQKGHYQISSLNRIKNRPWSQIFKISFDYKMSTSILYVLY